MSSFCTFIFGCNALQVSRAVKGVVTRDSALPSKLGLSDNLAGFEIAMMRVQRAPSVICASIPFDEHRQRIASMSVATRDKQHCKQSCCAIIERRVKRRGRQRD